MQASHFASQEPKTLFFIRFVRDPPPAARAQVLELPLCAQVLALAISNLCGSASTCAPEVLPLAPAEVLALPHKAQVLELALAEVLELPHEAEVLALSRAQLGGSRAHTNTYSKAMILYPKGNSMLLNTFLPLFW